MVIVCPLTQNAHSLTISNIYPYSKATGPIVTKFHIQLPWAKGTKLRSNSPGHMINIAAMPVHGKTFKTSLSGTSGPIALKFDL